VDNEGLARRSHNTASSSNVSLINPVHAVAHSSAFHFNIILACTPRCYMWSVSLRSSHHNLHNSLSELCGQQLKPCSLSPAVPSTVSHSNPSPLLNLVWTHHRAKSTIFPHFVNPMVHYRDHNSPTLVPILRQINAVCSFPSCLLKIHVNIIVHYTARSYKEFLAVRFFHKKSCILIRFRDCVVADFTGGSTKFNRLCKAAGHWVRSSVSWYWTAWGDRPLALWRHASRQTHIHRHAAIDSGLLSSFAVSDVSEESSTFVFGVK